MILIFIKYSLYLLAPSSSPQTNPPISATPLSLSDLPQIDPNDPDPKIPCQVCKATIQLDGKLHQHVVKCTSCSEAMVSSLLFRFYNYYNGSVTCVSNIIYYNSQSNRLLLVRFTFVALATVFSFVDRVLYALHALEKTGMLSS